MSIEWDFLIFTSYISVARSTQAIIIDKKKGLVWLEDGYVDSKKIEMPLTKEFLARVGSCFEEMHIFDWPKVSYNLCADGEQWSFEFYRGNERGLLKTGSNAYPNGYGKWVEFYGSLLMENGIIELHTCYKKEREGCISRTIDQCRNSGTCRQGTYS